MVAIIGVGFVGGAMKKSFQNKGIRTSTYDAHVESDSFEECLAHDIIFLCLPTPANENGYDITAIEQTCERLRGYQGVVVLKSTVLPGTTNALREKYELNVVHNPEFLTARTAFEDFHTQAHVVIGGVSKELFEFYQTHYTENVSVCTSVESECVKLWCNSFYASKVMLFNEFHKMASHLSADFEKIKGLMLKNGWIHPMHTSVPGPDGCFGFGGACFPKDTHALLTFLQNHELPCALLTQTVEENKHLRK